MSINASLHNATEARADELPGVKNDALKFLDAEGNIFSLFVPPHVAKATAAAFNRSMQADAAGRVRDTYDAVWEAHQ